MTQQTNSIMSKMTSNGVNHEHNQQNTCQYCPPKSNEPILTPGTKTKLTSFLGVCGSLSCYVAMFPLALVGIVGILGVSTTGIIPALNAYMASPLFNPILLVSIALLVIAMIPRGRTAVILSVIAGVLIFISMNIYMQAWLFLLAFVLLALAQIVGTYAKTRELTWKGIVLPALPLLIITVVLAISTYATPTAQNSTVPPPQTLQQQTPPTMMQMQ